MIERSRKWNPVAAMEYFTDIEAMFRSLREDMADLPPNLLKVEKRVAKAKVDILDLMKLHVEIEELQSEIAAVKSRRQKLAQSEPNERNKTNAR